MRARWWLAVAGWLSTAVVTTVLGVAVVTSGLLEPSDPPLTDADVARELSAPAPGATPPPATPAPSQAAPGVTRVLPTDGGSVVARCAGGQVALESWSPASGYRADDIVRGPAAVASVTFERHGGKGSLELRVTVRCAGGEPTATVQVDD